MDTAPGADGRRPVALALAGSLLLLLLIAGVAVVEARRAVVDDGLRRVAAASDAAAAALQRQADDRTRAVDAASGDSRLARALAHRRPADLAAAESALGVLALSELAPAAFVSDLQGRAVAIYPAQPELLGQDFSYRDWFRGVRASGRPYVSSGYLSAAAGRPPVVGVAAPVTAAGRRLGYVTFLWRLESVTDVVDKARLGDGVHLTVTDQRGLPFRNDLRTDARGEPLPSEVSDTTRRALAGERLRVVRDGTLLATASVPATGWSVTATQPEGSALATYRVFRWSLAEAVGVGLLLVLVFTGLLLRDLRRRERDAARVSEERERLGTLFDATPVGIIEGLPDGTVLACNAALAEMLDYSVDEILQLPAGELADPSQTRAISGSLEQVLAGEVSTYTAERVYRTKGGAPVPALVSVIVLRDGHGELLRMVAFVVDLRRQHADAKELRELAGRLAEREAFLQAVIDTMDVGLLACDADGRLTHVNRRVRETHGIPMDEPVTSLSSFSLAEVDGTPMDPDRVPLVRALRSGSDVEQELLIHPRDGRPVARMLARARPFVGADGTTAGAVVASLDVTALRAAEEALRTSEERMRQVFEEGLTGAALVSPDGTLLSVNAALEATLGGPGAGLEGRSLLELLADEDARLGLGAAMADPDSHFREEVRLLAQDGRLVWAETALLRLSADPAEPMLLQVEDVTAQRDAEQRLTQLSLHDELTGLPNRRLLVAECDKALAVARDGRGSSRVTLLFLDLDGFKQVNDRGGHELGDQVLVALAHDLQSALRPSDTIARVGGDEFVVLLADDEGLEQVRLVAERLGNTARRQVSVDGQAMPVSASIGIARVDAVAEPAVTSDDLLRRADAAMYRAKERGRDRHDLYDDALMHRTEARQRLQQEVRQALGEDRVELVYQPVVEIDSGRVVGAEALLRLLDTHGDPLPTLPAVVAAESAGLAEALGDRVLARALGTAARWPEQLTIAVNISAREITGRDFRLRVEDALELSGLAPSRLVLEITESAVLRCGPSAMAELERLRESGVKIAIDDFGTAYATLQNLTTLPVDELKVDASFTAGLPQGRAQSAVLHGVVSMAYEMGIPCVVEGVENHEQLEALRGLGVHAQGWYWGKPRGPEHVPGVPPQRTAEHRDS